MGTLQGGLSAHAQWRVQTQVCQRDPEPRAGSCVLAPLPSLVKRVAFWGNGSCCRHSPCENVAVISHVVQGQGLIRTARAHGREPELHGPASPSVLRACGHERGAGRAPPLQAQEQCRGRVLVKDTAIIKPTGACCGPRAGACNSLPPAFVPWDCPATDFPHAQPEG